MKTLHMGVYSSFIHNCPNLEAIKKSSSRRMDSKLWYIQWNIFKINFIEI